MPSVLGGSALLHEVAKRIIAKHLVVRGGATDVRVSRSVFDEAEAVDLTYVNGASMHRVKVKADAYCGSDPDKIAARELTYYRAATGSYGLEVVADTITRQPGWVQRSQADELYYYRIAIAQPEAEVRALMDEPDEVFFVELKVEADDLRIVPMQSLRAWFEATADRYTPRPVLTDGRSAWYRIVPESELERGVAGIQRVGPIFGALVRG